MASTIALFAQLKSFTYNLNHDISRLKREAAHEGKTSASPPILSSESDSFINNMACDVENIIGELEQMQIDVHYTEGHPSSLKTIVSKLRDYHSMNENLLNQLQTRVDSFAEKEKISKSKTSTKRSGKRGAQQGSGSLLATTTVKDPSGSSSGSAVVKKKETKRMSRGKAAPRRALEDLPPPPLNSTTTTTVSKCSGYGRQVSGGGSKAESPTAGLNAAKRGNATQKNIDMYKEKKLAGDVDAELDRSGPILSTGQIGAIMHPNDREGEREKEKEKEKEKEREREEEQEEEEEARPGLVPSVAESIPECYKSPCGLKVTSGTARKDSPETPGTPEMDESLRSALERINSSSKTHKSTNKNELRFSPGSEAKRAHSSTLVGTKEIKYDCTSQKTSESSFDSDCSVDMSLSSPPKNFDIKEPGTPTRLFGGMATTSSSKKKTPLFRDSARSTELGSPQKALEGGEDGDESEGPDFPMTKISVQDFATAPTFITYQTDVSALNRCVQCINKNIATTQCIAEQGRSTASLDKVKGDSGADGVTSDSRITFSEEALATLVPKKANVLALVTLKRLDMISENSGKRTYVVSES